MSNTDTPTERGGFWSSIPGVLTALATLVTAVGAAYLGYLQLNKDDSSSAAPVVQPAPTPAPAAPTGDTIIVVEDPNALREVAEEDPTSADPVEACAQGVQAACIQVFDMLADDCELGIMRACDLLWEVTPVGSDYEEYGGTCGYRNDGEYAGECEAVYG